MSHHSWEEPFFTLVYFHLRWGLAAIQFQTIQLQTSLLVQGGEDS